MLILNLPGDDREIEAPFEQRFERLHRALYGEHDVDIGVLQAERVDQPRQPVISGVALRAHPQHAGPVLAERAHIVFGPCEVVEHASRGGQDAFARRRRHHAPADAEEQRGTQAGLDVAQLVADGRLRQVDLGGGPRDAAGRGHCRHHPQVPDLEADHRIDQ